MSDISGGKIGNGRLSIILPVYNEEQNIDPVFLELFGALDKRYEYEVVAVDDGSQDRSLEKLKQIAAEHPQVKILAFSRNFGQTAAMSAGFAKASGDIVIPMDADLQNDPGDIPMFVSKIEEGYDVVSGWRKNRQDRLWSRRIPSQIANYVISKITGIELHDYGCTLKAYRKGIIRNIRLYGEMHRFIPALAAWQGARIAEIETNHRERRHGQTKYGISRTFRVLLDLLTVKFLMNYITKPMHFFGKIGFYCLFLSLLSGFFALFLRLFVHISFISTPLPLLTVFLAIVSLQFILMGLLAEILIRDYFESQGKAIYIIKEKINF